MSTEKGTENGRKGEKNTYRRNQQTDGAGQPGKTDLRLHAVAETKQMKKGRRSALLFFYMLLEEHLHIVTDRAVLSLGQCFEFRLKLRGEPYLDSLVFHFIPLSYDFADYDFDRQLFAAGVCALLHTPESK